MIITGVTNYFRTRWKENFDEEPDITMLNKWIQEDAVKIQNYITYFDKRRNELQTVLAAYWIIEKEVVVKIDAESRSAVTWYGIRDLNNG